MQTVYPYSGPIVPAGVRWGRPWIFWSAMTLGFIVIGVLGAYVSPFSVVVVMPLTFWSERYLRSSLFHDQTGFSVFTYNGMFQIAGRWEDLKIRSHPSDWHYFLDGQQFNPGNAAAFLSALARWAPEKLPRAMPNKETFAHSKHYGPFKHFVLIWLFYLVLVAGSFLLYGHFPAQRGYIFGPLTIVLAWLLTWIETCEQGVHIRRIGRRQFISWDDLAGWATITDGGTLFLKDGSGVTLHLGLAKSDSVAKAVEAFDVRNKFYC